MDNLLYSEDNKNVIFFESVKSIKLNKSIFESRQRWLG